MNLNRLLLFETVVREGSFSKAAAKLNCSQAKVSFHISKLQEELRIILFEKVGRNMQLTESGRKVFEETLAISASLERIENLKEANSDLSGKLTVLTNDTLLQFRLSEIIRKFRELAPGVALTLQVDTAKKVRDRILKCEADLGISFNMGDYPAPLSVLPLDSCELILAASPKLKLDPSTFFLPGEHPKIGLVATNSKTGPHLFFKKFLNSRKIKLGSEIHSSSIELSKLFLQQGLGVSYLFKRSVEKEIENGSLVEIPTALSFVDLGFILLKNSNHPESAAATLFSKLVRKELLNTSLDTNEFISRTCLMHRKPSKF